MKSFEIKASMGMWIKANNIDEAKGIAYGQLNQITRRYPSPVTVKLDYRERTAEEIMEYRENKRRLREKVPNSDFYFCDEHGVQSNCAHYKAEIL